MAQYEVLLSYCLLPGAKDAPPEKRPSTCIEHVFWWEKSRGIYVAPYTSIRFHSQNQIDPEKRNLWVHGTKLSQHKPSHKTLHCFTACLKCLIQNKKHVHSWHRKHMPYAWTELGILKKELLFLVMWSSILSKLILL